MKVIKITHYQGDDPEDISESIWSEDDDPRKIEEVCKRLVEYILPVFEGLQLIAEGIDEEGPYKTFSNGLSNTSYWVTVRVRR